MVYPAVYSNDWWYIFLGEVKVSCQCKELPCPETTQDDWCWLPEPSDCLSNRHAPHSQAGCADRSLTTQTSTARASPWIYCTATACHGQKPEQKDYVSCISLIFLLLSVAYYLYPDICNGNHVALWNACAVTYAFSRTDFPKKTCKYDLDICVCVHLCVSACMDLRACVCICVCM